MPIAYYFIEISELGEKEVLSMEPPIAHLFGAEEGGNFEIVAHDPTPVRVEAELAACGKRDL